MSTGKYRRVAGLALVALFVLGQAALFAHRLLVPHQACAEHGGELIHVGLRRVAPASNALAWLKGQPQSAAHGHDHCLAFTSRRQDAAAALGQLTAPSVTAPAAPEAATSNAVPVSRALRLLFAPKASPPV